MRTKPSLLVQTVASALTFVASSQASSARAAEPASLPAVSESSSAADGGGWRPHLSMTVGAEVGSAAREVDAPSDRQTLGYSRALSLQLAADILRHDVVGGGFWNVGMGGPANISFAGLRGGYRFATANLKVLGEAGLHTFFNVGAGMLGSSDVPGATLPFLGARVEWAPRAHRFFSPLVALGVRQDLTTTTTSGVVHGFLGPDDRRSYKLGGTTAGLQIGANFDFEELFTR